MQISDVQHYVRNQVWDTNTLSWVVMTAAAASGGGLTDAELRANPVPVQATIDTAGLATSGGQTTGNNSLSAIDSKLGGTLTVGTHAVTGTFWQTTQPVSGTFFQSTQPVSGSLGHLTIASATLTNVASSATSVQLLASTAGRRLATVFNDSTAVLFLKYGTTASATSFTVKIPAGGYFEFPHPVYTGRVDGIWESANGSARITEE